MTTMPGDSATTSVLVVCGAGASSTFVAMWLRRAAAARTLAVTASASSEDELDAVAPGVDVVLIGPHLAPRYDELARRVRHAGAVPALLSQAVIADHSGELALDVALDVAGAAGTGTGPGIGTDPDSPPTAHQENQHG